MTRHSALLCHCGWPAAALPAQSRPPVFNFTLAPVGKPSTSPLPQLANPQKHPCQDWLQTFNFTIAPVGKPSKTPLPGSATNPLSLCPFPPFSRPLLWPLAGPVCHPASSCVLRSLIITLLAGLSPQPRPPLPPSIPPRPPLRPLPSTHTPRLPPAYVAPVGRHRRSSPTGFFVVSFPWIRSGVF